MTTRGLSITRVVDENVAEPVSLDLLKTHLAIDADSTIWDDLLSQDLSAAREEVEEYCGISIVETQISVRWEELTTHELPYGPVKSITSVKDKDGGDIATHTMEGSEGGFMAIKADSCNPVSVSYVAGYVEGHDMASLRLAILKCASDHFTHRKGIALEGSVNSLPNDWKSVARKYSRKTWI